MSRRCAQCTACCEVLAVAEIDKPEGERCAHQCRRGCRIYTTRPATCRDYSCAWLSGLGKAADRPDRLGLVLRPYSHPTLGAMIQANEVWEGAADGNRAVVLLQRFQANEVTVAIVHRNGRRSFRPGVGKFELLKAMLEALASTAE